MRKIKNLLMMALLPLFSVALMVACENPGVDDGTGNGNGENETPITPPDVEKDSKIVLGSRSVSAAVSGGTCFMDYEITNPHQGEKISAVAAEDWVSNFNTSLSGAFSFDVAANDSNEARETFVTVSYRYAEDVTFTVRQGARTASSFSLEKVEGTNEYFSLTVNIYPEDATLPYIVMSASPSYIESEGLETAEELYMDDFLYFEYLGRFHGMSAVEVMQKRAKVGTQKGVTIGQATPGDTYVVYCYYFDYESGALLSDVARFDVTVDYPKVTEVGEDYFTFDYTIEGPRVFTDVKSSTDVDYYYDIMSETELEYAKSKGYTYESYIQLWWSTIVANFLHKDSLSPADTKAQNTCQGTNSDGSSRSTYAYDLLAETNYYIFAFNMDDNALCVTKPILRKITTGAVEPSDNQLTLTVEDVTAYRATVNITATADAYEDAYVSHIATKAEWNSWGFNDAQRQKYVRENLGLEYMWGSKTVKYSNIEPDTEYVAFAFGLYGGVVTTQLWTAEFTTKSDAPGEVDITLVDHGYYDPADLATSGDPSIEQLFGNASYQDSAIVPIDIEFSKKNHGHYFIEAYNWTNRYDEYNDEQYLSGLIWQIENKGTYTATDTYFLFPWDSRIVVVAIVVDVNGQYSSLFKREYNVSYDGVNTDIDSFVSWWNSWQSNSGGAELQSLVIEAPKAEAKAEAEVIEVDASISKVKAAKSLVKASEREFNFAKVTPDAVELNATR